MKTTQVILALVGAAAAGALAGILLAPCKGEETRANVRDFMLSQALGSKCRHMRMRKCHRPDSQPSAEVDEGAMPVNS